RSTMCGLLIFTLRECGAHREENGAADRLSASELVQPLHRPSVVAVTIRSFRSAAFRSCAGVNCDSSIATESARRFGRARQILLRRRPLRSSRTNGERATQDHIVNP